jgi:hypothetical protein
MSQLAAVVGGVVSGRPIARAGRPFPQRRRTFEQTDLSPLKAADRRGGSLADRGPIPCRSSAAAALIRAGRSPPARP